jgi:hypothetical protein
LTIKLSQTVTTLPEFFRQGATDQRLFMIETNLQKTQVTKAYSVAKLDGGA